MMRTSIIFLVSTALVACCLAAPVLDRRVRQASPSTSNSLSALDTMRSGLSVLSKHSKWRLTQSLNVSCSCLNSSSTENCQKFQSALSATCRLYEANKILPNINLPDNTTQQVLEIMSEKGVQDACIWVNETLRQVNPQAGLPSEVVCSNVSTLDSLCSQWSEVTSIMRIEAKVDLLGASIEEDKWFESHNDLTRAELYSGC